jgi:hypothetical protein
MNPAASNRPGTARVLAKSVSSAISPNTARNTTVGTGNTAGRRNTCAKTEVNAALVTGSGATAL